MVRSEPIGRSILRVMALGLFLVLLGATTIVCAPALLVFRLGPLPRRAGERPPPDYGVTVLGWILRGINPGAGRRDPDQRSGPGTS